MKKILVTQRLDEFGLHHEKRTSLDLNWGSLFSRLQLMPIILPYGIDPSKYMKELEISGAVLTGGNDLYQCSKNELSALRDEFEKKLVQDLIKQRIPLFAVCRGMQLIAALNNATISKKEGHVAKEHEIRINPGSKYFNELKDIKTVNSYHSFVVETLPHDFIETARALDGTIEAMEHKELPIFCQMWHPERESSHSKLNDMFIDNFFKGK